MGIEFAGDTNYGPIDGDVAFGVEAEPGELVGYLYGRVELDDVWPAYVCELAVLPAFRGRGLGRQLLRAFAEFCDSNHVEDITVMTLWSDRHWLMDYFRACGFEPGDDEDLMPDEEHAAQGPRSARPASLS